MTTLRTWSTVLLVACAGVLMPAFASALPFIGPFNMVDTIASTVPGNGDLNPYGTAVVPRTMGHLVQGNVLVSNFNDMNNDQGTGTTIVEIAPNGSTQLFAQIDPAAVPACRGGIGLTTALVVLRAGWVIVGSLPTANGMAATAQAGCLLVLNSSGRVVEVIKGSPINGPWDMTAADFGTFVVLFVTNVLNGTVAASPGVVNKGTVVRINLVIGDGDNDADDQNAVPHVLTRTVIGSGFGERTDPDALVIGPTGVGLGANGTLYVADTLANRIAAIPNALSRFSSAGTGKTVTVDGSLNAPLGLAIAPGGDILTVNAGDGNIVETTPGGAQVAVKTLDSSGSPPGAGALFGLAITPSGNGVYFVDDATNELDLLH